MLAGFALSFLLFPPDYPLVSPTPAPWPWRWCDPGTCPSRRCCAGWSPQPCTPPSAPCSSPPWWEPASRPPGAASNFPRVQGEGKERRRTRGHGPLSITHPAGRRWADVSRNRTDTYVDPLAVVGEVHLVEARFIGEVVYLHWVILLQRRICVSQLAWVSCPTRC